MANVSKVQTSTRKETKLVETEVPIYSYELILSEEEIQFIAALVGSTNHDLSYKLYGALGIDYSQNQFKVTGDTKVEKKVK